MQLGLEVLAMFSLIELLLWIPLLWGWRKPIAYVTLVGLLLANCYLVAVRPSLWTLIILFLSVYRLVNILRLITGRSLADYLFNAARRSSLVLIGLQLVVVSAVGLNNYLRLSSLTWSYLLAFGQFITAVIVLSSTFRHLRTTRSDLVASSYADQDLPTLTVAIPARNETDNLEVCLRSLLETNYPKLEILVLDDCSQDKRTPEIIRSFAQRGVRFIAGKVPPDNWLAKNYAYQQLTEQASGEMLLFCGVDVRFEAESLKSLLAVALKKKKTMLSVIPGNKLSNKWNPLALMVQPSRYAWELALPRRWLRRPPVLSSCWLISKELLVGSGGFEAVAHSISPESYFARQAILANDGYSFIQSPKQSTIHSVKSLDDQQATAIRIRYPQLHRRPEVTCLITALELAMLTTPLIVLIVSFSLGLWPLFAASLISYGLQAIAYGQIVNLTYRTVLWRGYLMLPLAAIYDVALLNYSMWRYEFRQVIWKDRNVCVPVMRVSQGGNPIVT